MIVKDFRWIILIFVLLASCGPSTVYPTATLPIGDFLSQTEGDPPSIIATSTPYITIFNGFFNCRQEPNTSSPVLVLIQGQQVTITAQNQGWLYVTVQYFDKPCWVAMTEILNLDPNSIALVPPYIASIGTIASPTFTLPPDTRPTSYQTREPDPPTAIFILSDTPKPVVPSDTPKPVKPSETPRPRRCNDGIDNDGDGAVDMADPQCRSSNDNSEGDDD